MKFDDFDRLVEYVVEKCIKGVMCAKSAEYAREGDKLYNFKRAAEVSGKTSLECLQGMKLKHDVSILDMLADEADPTKRTHSLELWEEKISDDINYLILMLALLYEKHGWDLPGLIPAETKPGYGGSAEVIKACGTCAYLYVLPSKLPCNGCYDVEPHPNWELGK